MNNPLRLALPSAVDSIESESRKPLSEALAPRFAPNEVAFTPTIDHWVLQLHGVPTRRIDDTDRLRTLLSDLVAGLELTAVSAHTHYFGPGVSAVIILSESHLSAHTWPEHQYMHVDIVTCVCRLTERRLRLAFGEVFAPRRMSIVQLDYTREETLAAETR